MGAGPSSQASTPSPSPFSLRPSPESPSRLCKISKEQAEEFDKVINFLKDSEFKMLKDSTVPDIPSNVAVKLFQLPSYSFDRKQSYLKDPDINQHPLLIKRILCLMLIDIFLEYRNILKKIHALCIECRSGGEAVDGVEVKINDIITNDLIRAQTLFNSFNQYFVNYREDTDTYIQSLKSNFDKLRETNDMFLNDSIKSEMINICAKRQEWQQVKIGAALSKGGKSSSSRSKKRKQMKMKMKSSNYRSKTRNSKKKHNGNGVKK